MAKHGKNYKSAAEKVDSTKLYTPKEAMELAKELSSAKFDETVEVAVRRPEHPRLHLPAPRHRQDRPRRRLRRGRQGYRGRGGWC